MKCSATYYDTRMSIFDEYYLKFLRLTETWHEDADSIAIKRLQGMGLNVTEVARAIPGGTQLDNVHFINHGDKASVSKPGTNIAKVETKLKPKTFEHLCCRVGGGFTPFLLMAIYRPGLQRVSDQFFKEFSTLFESLATFNSAIMDAGDMNIHLERPTDADTQMFYQLTDAFRLRQLVCEQTHDHGGLLDVVLSSVDVVTVSELGLSNHKLIHWSISTARSCPVYTKTLCRRWKCFNSDLFSVHCKAQSVSGSPLCQPVDSGRTATDLAECYHAEITNILDNLVPVTEMSMCNRPHRPFHDEDLTGTTISTAS